MAKPVDEGESPFHRAAREGLNDADSGSRGGKKRKRKSRPKPTSKAKGKRQSTKERYAKARDDAEREGLIPTIPDGGVRDERVRGEGEVAFPGLVIRAVREGWLDETADVSRHVKEMAAIVEDPDAKAKDKVAAFKALTALAQLGLQADKMQWERANPAQAGQIKGAATVAVSVQNNVLAAQVIREALESGSPGGDLGLPPLGEPRGLGESRFDGEVEVGAASTSYQRDPDARMADSQQ